MAAQFIPHGTVFPRAPLGRGLPGQAVAPATWGCCGHLGTPTLCPASLPTPLTRLWGEVRLWFWPSPAEPPNPRLLQTPEAATL